MSLLLWTIVLSGIVYYTHNLVEDFREYFKFVSLVRRAKLHRWRQGCDQRELSRQFEV
jgi:hypothetical protein